MTQSPIAPPRADSASPTPYEPLNAVLATMLSGAKRVLGDNFVGAYLQGSFALGDFDEASDCDFVVATKRDLTADEQAALDAMHTAIHEMPAPWGHRLEGSYVPADILRKLTAEPRDPPGHEPRAANWQDPGASGSPPRVYPLLFLGHGHKTLERSEHDNTQVVRWVTREKGVVLAGPPPTELIDPVLPEALRAEMRTLLRRETPVWTNDPAKMDLYWLQCFFVTLYCRVLHTLQTGEVRSKQAASDWAIANLESRWKPLIEKAYALRTLPRDVVMGPANRAAVAETLAFMRHALRVDARMTEQRAKAARLGPDPSHTGGPAKFTPKGVQHGRGPGRSVAPPSRPLGGGRRV